MQHSLMQSFWAVRDYISPVLLESKFKESGRITPDEFVAAGDYLVYKFPTWSWEHGEEGKKREFLPADKQYLVQRNVPCLRRVSQLAYSSGVDEDSETLLSFAMGASASDGGDDWVATHTSKDPSSLTKGTNTFGDIPDLETSLATTHLHNEPYSSSNKLLSEPEPEKEEMPDLDDIPDMDDELEAAGGAGGLVEEEDEAAFKPAVPAKHSATGGGDNLVQVRTYDCFISYDKYYQTPRMWLLGYDEHKTPLPPASALDDVSADHAQKTVTIEPFPHSSLSMASVHPCKHSSVMKKVIERMDKGVVEAQRKEREREKKEGSSTKGKWKKLLGGKDKDKDKERRDGGEEEEEGPEGLRVDQYLVVFLKFISTIVPTIEVDATNSI